MNAATKKGLVVVSALLLIGGLLAYLYSRREKTTEESKPGEGAGSEGAETSSGGASTGGTKPSTTSPKGTGSVKPKPPAQVQVQTQQIKLVRASDVLASTPNPTGKLLYAGTDGVGVYNMNSELAFKTKKNQYLGAISQVRKNNAGIYVINFVTTGGVKYWTIATGMLIKV